MMIDWSILKELRQQFLENPTGGDYWVSEEQLKNYDATFARRIEWKWQSVFRELDQLGWKPPECGIYDWGCGTGVAAESFLNWQKAVWVAVEDRSSLARQFAKNKLEKLISIEETPEGKPFTLLLSHVLNELNKKQLERLMSLTVQAQAILWIEPGTREHSQRLVKIRERLLGDFNPVAPCPDNKPCALAKDVEKKFWCHHFAEVPSQVHQDSDWRRFSKETGIDLRSLPMSFLVLDKRPFAVTNSTRVLGRPRIHGGFVEAALCRESEVKSVKFTKTKSREIFQKLKKETFGPLIKLE